MIKYILIIALPLLAGSCSASHDASFYSLHPNALQQAIDQCPGTHPAGVACEQLNQLAVRANTLASELHDNPQAFGKKILALQEDLAKLTDELQNNPQQPELQAAINSNKMQLGERLAVVKWLESPRG